MLPPDLYLVEHDYPMEFAEELISKLGKAPIVKVDDPIWDKLVSSREAAIGVFRQHLASSFLEKKTKEIKPVPELGHIIGDSEVMMELKSKIKKYAASDKPVLILGETGTGKELVAQAVHDLSPRKEKPFIVQNCAAIPMTLAESEFMGSVRGAYTGASDRQGLFYEADAGTLFLDEIGDLEKEIQVKFLRVLETGDYRRIGSAASQHTNFRLVCATNRDLKAMVKQGTFREDLYHRINTLILRLPPLKERGNDVFVLAQHFYPDLDMTDAAWTWLRQYAWPGNIRELKAVLDRAVMDAEGETITLNHLKE